MFDDLEHVLQPVEIIDIFMNRHYSSFLFTFLNISFKIAT